MVSKNQLKLITSLHQKKYRNKYNLFVAEGIKVINEYLDAGFELHQLFATSFDAFHSEGKNEVEITETELKKISRLNSPNVGVALFKIPAAKPIVKDKLIVGLDEVNDPGNLGTIIRLCDWFGVRQLVCSENTVDCYNPKVIQATMGSLSRVNVSYISLKTFLTEAELPIFAAMMDGENVYEAHLPENGILIMGNEANGISEEILQAVTKSISIPRFGDLQQTESLNVATATAILLSEFKRR
ncbi:RNA methyltransferase, TrmH family [Pustulibacterium marinum]|uniref:RNA methyltransferase, TrmH family n=1 Tax=Pustulibacterium marinum TaxID=1224947 RepID=A0A1I7G6Y7_9FLAO|nr:RNA methyltransferase [Pustulibacterium marinum]SFU44242.1 RNA methyltransferase, TrmH family [Pustulibacterium marinum]